MVGGIMNRFFRQFRTNFITGLFLIIPLFVTIIIIVKLFQWIDSALPGIVGVEMPPGLGALITVIIAYFAGLTAKNYFGKKLIATGNAIIANIPILNKVYLAIQQIVDAISLNNKKLFERAVLIEYPKAGCYTIGFVTSDDNTDFSMKVGQKLLAIFVATTPNPTSGYLLYIPEEDVIDLHLPVDIAIKLVMSGGILSTDHAARLQASIPKSVKGWNWMNIFKKSGQPPVASDPRD